MSCFWTNKTDQKPPTALKVLSSALFFTTLAVSGVATAAPLDGGRIGYVLTKSQLPGNEEIDVSRMPQASRFLFKP